MKLLIASPPCQAWSMAGKREGLKDQARVFDLCALWANHPTAPRPTEEWHDERSPLAAEPMRWAASLRPDLLAWEQVPPVLDLWKFCADLLRPLGYSTWTGILSAERFGVPQTRKRAILLASRIGQVHPPHPTHQAYVAGEPARHDFTLEGEILPWVSMADALGWNADVPAPTVTGGGTDAGGPEPFGRGGASANLPSYRRTRGPGMTERHGERRAHPATEPAPALTSKARSDEWEYDRRQGNTTTGGGTDHGPTHPGE